MTVSSLSPFQKVSLNDSSGDLEIWALQHPLQPILTRTAIQETPRPGERLHAAIVPQRVKDLLELYDIRQIQTAEHSDTIVSVDEALYGPPFTYYQWFCMLTCRYRDNKLVIDPTLHDQIVDIHRHVPSLLPKSKMYCTPQAVEEFLRMESPPPDHVELETTPIFPQDQYLRRKSSAFCPTDGGLSAAFRTFPNLSPAWLAPVEVEEEDLANEHLSVVGGRGMLAANEIRHLLTFDVQV